MDPHPSGGPDSPLAGQSTDQRSTVKGRLGGETPGFEAVLQELPVPTRVAELSEPQFPRLKIAMFPAHTVEVMKIS